ncbi:MAG TPA: hypothetical protein VJ770_24000 [Stellaceae bacterium]|nr:hypothetical protein [Stellaceae bacterium]
MIKNMAKENKRTVRPKTSKGTYHQEKKDRSLLMNKIKTKINRAWAI